MEPLSRHVLFTTDDPARAEYEGGRVMSAHRVLPDRSEPFTARFHAVSIGSSELIYFSYSGSVVLEATTPIDYYTIQIAATGAFEVASGGHRVTATRRSACVLSPADRLRIEFTPGTAQLAFRVPSARINQVFGQLGGGLLRQPIAFQVSADQSASWLPAIRLAVRTIDQCDQGVIDPRLGLGIEQMLVTSLLLGQPHSGSSGMIRPAGGRGYRAVEAVAREMRLAEHSVDIAQLASDAGVSVRTLQDGFRSHYGRSPSEYLRELRLEKAHRMLAGADPSGGETVTTVALTCGFNHLGRFAAYYRARYGVSPSVTLSEHLPATG